MKKTILSAVLSLAFFATGTLTALCESLVILHTNDTHSLIDPDPQDGRGGVLQRQALIDSVRKAEKNVLLVDAGDMVQGTLYFKFFKGDVEYPLMNMAGYDIRILGNHEFDNGLEDLAKYQKDVRAKRLSANYDFSDTPLKGMFDPYVIKKVGGKKIGFLGINVDPSSLITEQNREGMKFLDVISTANATAAFLKNEKKCDLVVAVTHIGVKKENGKTTDYELAAASKDIDVIIGGHSHTVIRPGNQGNYPCYVDNAEGRPVLVTQTGKYGKYLGYIKIDLDKLEKSVPTDYSYQLLEVTDRFPASSFNKKMQSFLVPYRHVVDSVNGRVIARAALSLNSDDRNGGYANWAADFAKLYASRRLDSLRRTDKTIPEIDFGLMNVGGIRHNMPAGDVTEGQILSTFPFSNHLVVGAIKGQDFIDAMAVAAKKGGEAISDELRVVTDDKGNLLRVVINGEEMDPYKEYVYATIDYLFEGNDDLVSLARSKLVWRDDVEVSIPILRYVESQGRLGIPIAPDMNGRFVKEARW
ncbi:MAG: bifunctional metallophosphatase/5'-nucleotidase [Clostridium sp.]|nr:bifunctional metallophosphatase/5'-nucleotidase [Prevotella sp.]MCM1428312.1 bifunctional metallophosphatase/5'-nucleotidase [Clostridium sp.]MCM1474784.1 bifunctional metallophosphatase/5'-nucleotidase [Muribaculaceae bacterium]